MASRRAARLGASTSALAALITACFMTCFAGTASAQSEAVLESRLDRLEAAIESAEDLAAIKRLQRAYGYYLDKGMWADLAELFTQDAVANYPAGVYVGKDSITRHFFLNVGGGEMGEIGLGHGRLYNHMNIQPVVHLDQGGETAKGRGRALAMFGRLGSAATWAEGVYNVTYAKEDGAWKIRTLDYHSGFGAPYETGWVAPEEPRAAGGRRNLPHPADRERNMECDGFPDACIAPFHYANPGTPAGGSAWTASVRRLDAARESGWPLESRASTLARRAERLADEQSIENLIKIYGYYFDRRMWDDVADLFADGGTIELAQRGVYEGKARIRAFLDLLGPQGLSDGQLFDHVQLQPIVTVAADGSSAKARNRAFVMTGVLEQGGEWSEGVYENTFIKEDGAWKLASLRYYPTFISDYDQGWGRDARPAPGISETLPPDRPPTDAYEIYPTAHIPPFHYRNPATGLPPQYPREAGRPSAAALEAVLAPVVTPGRSPRADAEVPDVEALVAESERTIMRVKDYHELENLENAYGYYLDKNLWSDLADLFAADGSMELAQRGVYQGRERVRGFLFEVFGAEGPQPGRLGNHLHMQPVIHVAPDGQSAKIRSRMMQQLSFGGRPSMGAAIYENEAVKEDGAWKFRKVHAFNTWTAGYDGGWARSPGTRVPGPSESYPPDAPPSFRFEMFPTVYDIPFHYANPVSGRPATGSEPTDVAAAPNDARFGRGATSSGAGNE